jgi:hypothetical protein
MRELRVKVLDRSPDIDSLERSDVVLAKIGKEIGYMVCADNSNNNLVLISQSHPRSEVVKEFVLRREMTIAKDPGELHTVQGHLVPDRYQPGEECYDNYKLILQGAGLWQQ